MTSVDLTNVADVGMPRRIGEHLQAIELGPRRIDGDLEGATLGPVRLPLAVECLRTVVGHVRTVADGSRLPAPGQSQ